MMLLGCYARLWKQILDAQHSADATAVTAAAMQQQAKGING